MSEQVSFDFSRPLQTKSGEQLRILATDAPGDFPIIAMGDNGRILKYTHNGICCEQNPNDNIVYVEQHNAMFISVPRLSNVFEYISMYGDKSSVYSSKFSAFSNSLDFNGPLVSVIKLEYINGVLQGVSLVRGNE